MKVLITGGSGLIGMSLTKKLLSEGIEVTHLTRHKNSKAGVKTYEWNWEKNFLEENALNGVTHLVHLAGAGIADKPWTMARKRLIVKSRVLTARLLHDRVREKNIPLEAFVSASGIGYYGAVTTDTIFTENDPRGSDFVAECCVQWEREADTFSDVCRVVKLRTGIVLDRNEGAVGKIASSIRRGMGAPLGSGKQYMPWIHIDDLVNAYYESIINNKWDGVFNAVASPQSTNEEFTKALGKAMNKRLMLPRVPKFMLKFIFGELSEILLNGSQVSNQKILDTGIKLNHNDLNEAMNSLFEKN